MSMIPCTESCVYQKDGNCSLERVASRGTPDDSGAQCVHYIEKQLPKAR